MLEIKRMFDALKSAGGVTDYQLSYADGKLYVKIMKYAPLINKVEIEHILDKEMDVESIICIVQELWNRIISATAQKL